MQNVEFAQIKQFAIKSEHASHLTVAGLKKVLLSQREQTIAEAQVIHEEIRFGHV